MEKNGLKFYYNVFYITTKLWWEKLLIRDIIYNSFARIITSGRDWRTPICCCCSQHLFLFFSYYVQSTFSSPRPRVDPAHSPGTRRTFGSEWFPLNCSGSWRKKPSSRLEWRGRRRIWTLPGRRISPCLWVRCVEWASCWWKSKKKMEFRAHYDFFLYCKICVTKHIRLWLEFKLSEWPWVRPPYAVHALYCLVSSVGRAFAF